MQSPRPFTTLFLLQSVDGKISTGAHDERDVDKDFPLIAGVAEGLNQYYQLEKQTDQYSLNSGKVMAKIGVNQRTEKPKKIGCSFIIIDNQPHLTSRGVAYLTQWVQTLYLVTTNKQHPAYDLKKQYDNLVMIEFVQKINFTKLLEQLRLEHSIEKLTIQSGSTLNANWIRRGLIDQVSLVIAPCLIGGINTPSLIGGDSLQTKADLSQIKALKLINCQQLENSYLHLTYKVINITNII